MSYSQPYHNIFTRQLPGWSLLIEMYLRPHPPNSSNQNGIALKDFHKVCHRHHLGRLCCSMRWVCIMADKMQSIVTGIGTVSSHSCLRFLCGLPLSLSLPGRTGNWFWFWRQRHGFKRSCYFRAKSLAKLVVFWVISVDVVI